MKKHFLILLSFFFATICIAQPPSIQWAKCYGYGDQDYARSIIQTNDGGYIVAGESYTFYDSTTIDNHGLFDMLIIKLDSQGNIQWKKFYGGSGYDGANAILQTPDSGFIIAGYTSSDDGDVTSFIGGQDGWIIKIDSVGVIQWQKTIGGINSDYISTMKKDYNGYIVVGYSSSSDSLVSANHGIEDYWVTKIDSVGNVQWQKLYGGSSYDDATSIVITSDSGYVVAGYSSSDDSDVVGNHGAYDFWILKLDSLGNSVWKNTFGGMYSENANSILQTDDDGFIILGSSESNDGDVSGNHGYGDIWFVKLNSLGNLLWQKCLGGSQMDYGTTMCKTNNNRFAVAGYSLSSDGDATFNHGDYDYWVAELDSNANIIWQQSYGGGGIDIPHSILQTNDSGLAIAGLTQSSNDGDVSNHIGGNCYGDSCSDYWIVKLAPLTTSNFEIQSSPLVFSINPNPTNDNFTIKLNLETRNALLEIYNMFGENVYAATIFSKQQTIVNKFPSGIYLVKVTDGEKQFTEKLIVQ